MRLTLIFLFLVGVQGNWLFGQNSIKFQDISFNDALSQAAKQDKLIFLDGFTSWCAPCKWMDSNVFTQKDVADYFNSMFINVKYDCEKGEGIDIAKKYQIKSFPTYLFLNGKGELVYRTQSRMDAHLFLKEGQKANNPHYHIQTLQQKFDEGERSSEFLLRYILVMNNVDQKAANEGKKALDEVASDDFLLSRDGWEIIKMMARSNNDKYGKFFQENKSYFKGIADPADFSSKEGQLLRYAMYGYIRNNQKNQFDEGLKFFDGSSNNEMKIETAMFKVEWAGVNGTSQEFIDITDQLRKGVLKDADEKLSFIARRFGNPQMDVFKQGNLQQCYILAKQAVDLNPASYSNQATFAELCISLKKKKEAIKAAKAARELAEVETSKIQKLADALVVRAQSI